MQVQLAGDFNDWSLVGSEMEAVGPVWEKTLKLAPGRYRYRYVIDGEWHSDPHNAAAEPSPFGGVDSVLVLDAPQPAEEPLPQTKAYGTASAPRPERAGCLPVGPATGPRPRGSLTRVPV